MNEYKSQSIRKNKKFGIISVNYNKVQLKRLSVYCVAKEYNLQKLADFLGPINFARFDSVIGFKCKREFNANFHSNLKQYIFQSPYSTELSEFTENLCYMFFFEFGVIVFWNMTDMEEKAIISEIKDYAIKPQSYFEHDNVNFQESNIEEEIALDPQSYIIRDHLRLCGNSFEEKLAVSYGFAQSVKLSYFETDIDNSIDEARKLAEDLESNGEVKLDHKTLNKKIGKLYLKKNEINLDTDLLDIPDFLWNHEKYQKHFTTMIKYFEVEKRIEILNHRLDIIGDLLYLLSEEMNVQNVMKLDWIIVFLIAFNVAILFFWDILVKDLLKIY